MFNGAHLHLLLNHIPVLGPLFALPLLVIGVLKSKNELIKYGLIFTIAIGISAIPAFLTGEEAEHTVEGILGVNESAIEEHEEQAEIAYYLMLMTGAIALGTLLAGIKNEKYAPALVWITIIAMLIAFALMARTAFSGGHIRHTEINIQSGNVAKEHDD